jgi:hypothetical protein
METLRKAMQKEGAIPGHIHLVIARKIGAPSPSPFQESSTDYFLYNHNKSSDYSESNDSKINFQIYMKIERFPRC